LRLLREQRPDAIWTSLTGASILGQLCGKWLRIPVVSWQHNASLRAGNRWLLRRTRAIPTLWVADSESVGRFAIERLGVDAARLHIWPLFIAKPAPLAQPWTGDGIFHIGSLGRLHPNKGYDVLIRALALMQSREPGLATRFELCIAGSGTEQAALQQLADQLGVRNLRFAGFVADTAGFLAGLHAYVQPSRTEGLCIAAHEAMLAGLPVIASPVGQLAHSIVDSYSGWLCRPGDAAQLAMALTSVIADSAEAAVVGQRARTRVLELFGRERFETQGAQLLRLLEQQVQLGR
jgi:glycosyltransferase involved in cell wall biosynthesis